MEIVASLSQGRTAAAQCGLFTYKSVLVIFEPPCIIYIYICQHHFIHNGTLLHVSALKVPSSGSTDSFCEQSHKVFCFQAYEL